MFVYALCTSAFARDYLSPLLLALFIEHDSYIHEYKYIYYIGIEIKFNNQLKACHSVQYTLAESIATHIAVVRHLITSII